MFCEVWKGKALPQRHFRILHQRWYHGAQEASRKEGCPRCAGVFAASPPRNRRPRAGQRRLPRRARRKTPSACVSAERRSFPNQSYRLRSRSQITEGHNFLLRPLQDADSPAWVGVRATMQKIAAPAHQFSSEQRIINTSSATYCACFGEFTYSVTFAVYLMSKTARRARCITLKCSVSP